MRGEVEIPGGDPVVYGADAALVIGERVFEMLERLQPMLSIHPNARINGVILIDGKPYKLALSAWEQPNG